MRWHLRNLICVIHNRTIGGHVTLDRYLAWHVSTIVCLRSLISLELHYATRPAEKSTYTVYVVSEFEVLFRHVPWSQTPRYVSSTLKMLRGWLTYYFRCHSAVAFHVVRDCMWFLCVFFLYVFFLYVFLVFSFGTSSTTESINTVSTFTFFKSCVLFLRCEVPTS